MVWSGDRGHESGRICAILAGRWIGSDQEFDRMAERVHELRWPWLPLWLKTQANDTSSVDEQHHAGEHEAEHEQHDSKQPRAGAHFAEPGAKVLDLEEGILGKEGHEAADDDENGGED